jgi:hypothetical protein
MEGFHITSVVIYFGNCKKKNTFNFNTALCVGDAIVEALNRKNDSDTHRLARPENRRLVKKCFEYCSHTLHTASVTIPSDEYQILRSIIQLLTSIKHQHART